MRCVAGGERGEKKNEEAMGEGAHVLLAAAIMISCGHQDGTCQAVSLSRQGQRALLPRLWNGGTYRGRPASQLIKRLSGKGRQA